jgi:hypothetical protein
MRTRVENGDPWRFRGRAAWTALSLLVVGEVGSECALGTGGTHDWLGVPAGSLYFLIVGVDITNVYESSWGTDSSDTERNGVTPSKQCGVTYKILSETCP